MLRNVDIDNSCHAVLGIRIKSCLQPPQLPQVES